jgi:hypothetical protein
MSYKIAALPQTLIEPMWSAVEPHLARVTDIVSDETTTKHIREKALTGEVLIIVICKGADIIAAMTADIRTYDTGLKALHIPQLGGDDFFEFRDQLDLVITAIAKDFGCDQLRVIGRRGWVKALKDLGWEEQYVVLKKDLEA